MKKGFFNRKEKDNICEILVVETKTAASLQRSYFSSCLKKLKFIF